MRLPSEVGLVGKPDSVHLTYTVRENRVCLTRNYGDFENLQSASVRLAVSP